MSEFFINDFPIMCRSYLSKQDLMLVTKRSCRDALSSIFPNADVSDFFASHSIFRY